MISAGSDPAVSHAFCKLLVAIGDHSDTYLATNLASSKPVAVANLSEMGMPVTRAQVVQHFLKCVLTFTGLPGFYGVDEEESEMTLGFWYIFQEALWSAEFDPDEVADEENERVNGKEQWPLVEAVYSELVRVLRAKVVWPVREILNTWSSGESILDDLCLCINEWHDVG
jgi:hypothetical protein